MMSNAGPPAFEIVSPSNLDLYRFYPAQETAERIGATVEALDEWVRQGFLKPVILDGEPEFSGFAIARILGWPVSDDPGVYLPEQDLE